MFAAIFIGNTLNFSAQPQRSLRLGGFLRFAERTTSRNAQTRIGKGECFNASWVFGASHKTAETQRTPRLRREWWVPLMLACSVYSVTLLFSKP